MEKAGPTANRDPGGSPVLHVSHVLDGVEEIKAALQEKNYNTKAPYPMKTKKNVFGQCFALNRCSKAKT